MIPSKINHKYISLIRFNSAEVKSLGLTGLSPKLIEKPRDIAHMSNPVAKMAK